MDFFKHQKQARQESVKLLVLFILGVSLVIIATTVLFVPIFYYLFGLPMFETAIDGSIENYLDLSHLGLKAFRAVVFFVLFSVGGGALFKLVQLGKGGKVIAQMLKARELSISGLDPVKKREIKNVTAEMAIASGIRPPAIYIVDDSSINALAAGLEIKDSVICLTSGAVEQLNRDELSALIAHELGHILGRDAETNMYLASIMHGLMMFTIMGRILLKNNDFGRDRFNPALCFVGVILIFAGYIGRSVAGFIQLLYSHEREYLADACAVQYTRSKEGILGVFQKIWYRRQHNQLKSVYAMEVAHFMFTPALSSEDGELSTHPSLKARAKRVDASFRFRKYPPASSYDSKKVRTSIPKIEPEEEGTSPDDFLQKLLSSSSFSNGLNFTLLTFASHTVAHQRYNTVKSRLNNAIEDASNKTLKFRLWLALEALNEQYAIIEAGIRKKQFKLYRKTHPLTYLELEFVIVISTFLECTNSEYSERIKKEFKKAFPWCQELITIDRITQESFSSSLDKLAALNTDSKKVVYDFIEMVINIDGRVSFEEEEFFKTLCERLNMPVPKGAR